MLAMSLVCEQFQVAADKFFISLYNAVQLFYVSLNL